MPDRFRTISPLDGSVVWEGPASTPAEVAAAIRRARNAAPGWWAVPPAGRAAIVRRYAEQLDRRRDAFAELLTREVGKLRWDARGEVAAAIAKADLSIRAWQQRRPDERVQDGNVTRVVRYRPIGVSLVLGPFNFPLHLPGGQIIPLLLAGNPVVFKPSELATGVAEQMRTAWLDAGLPPDVLQLVRGGADVAAAAIDAQELGGVFLTGSRSAGEAIHRRLAGRPEVLLAFELGGNSPVVVAPDADPAAAAAALSFAAFVSSGQRCTCARRALFVRGDASAAQIDALIERSRGLRVGDPGDRPSPHLGPLVSPAAAGRLRAAYDRLLGLGCRAVLPLRAQGNRVHPTIVDATGLGDEAWGQIGATEWFGPMLVIRRSHDFSAALMDAARSPYGLAAALFGGSEAMFEQCLRAVPAGVMHHNRPTTGAAGVMPFGGLGASGNHRPAGYHAIDACGDPIASLQQAELDTADPWDLTQA